mmetsp:Transcript_60724/g.100456  ORF Transcript_60724/g.100456 Transcript_60724/m.100456 type:complete len:117 (+) Transcript_60724:1-351(+)
MMSAPQTPPPPPRGGLGAPGTGTPRMPMSAYSDTPSPRPLLFMSLSSVIANITSVQTNVDPLNAHLFASHNIDSIIFYGLLSSSVQPPPLQLSGSSNVLNIGFCVKSVEPRHQSRD